MTEQVLDFRGFLRLVRQRWRVVAAFVLAGLLAVAAFVALRPPQYRATSLVLLPPQGSGTSGTTSPTLSATTEARIATSAAVLVPAGREANQQLSLGQLQSHVSASSAAESVLRITATGSNRAEAEALANAVAIQLVTFVATSGSTASGELVTALRAESAQLKTQIADVKQEITANDHQEASDTTTGSLQRQDAKLSQRLEAEQSSLTLQLHTVQSQIAEAQLRDIAANQGIQILQRAGTATPPSWMGLALLGLIGAVAGLLVGCLVVLVLQHKDRRLWARDTLGAAVGAPVLMSVDVPKRHSLHAWTSLFDTYQPTAIEQWNTRRALRDLGQGDGQAAALTVLVMAGDTAAAGLAAHMALATALSGTRTGFVVAATDDDRMASLRAVCSRFEGDHTPRPGLVVGDAGVATAQGLDLTVTVLVLDPDHPSEALGTRTGETMILAISTGYASAEQLARVAIAATDSGSPLRGVVVANPVTADETVGRAEATSLSAPPVRGGSLASSGVASRSHR